MLPMGILQGKLLIPSLLRHDAYTKLYRQFPKLIRQGLEGEGFSLVPAKTIFFATTKFRVLH